MTSDRKWNVEDVQRLVNRIQEAQIMSKVLEDELRPFLPDPPDPDAELVETINGVLQDTGPMRPDTMARNIIAVVRDHDAKAVAK